MPLYDYECTSCSHRFEVRQSFSDAPVAECPQCETESRRLFRPVPVIYKGTGFYTTDYARKVRSGSSENVESKSKEPAGASAD